MRPVIRGSCPQRNEQNIIFSHYSEARGELIYRLGQFCSYCEMKLDASLAVEHVQPKKPSNSQTINTQRNLDWNNFLLACANCNSTKNNVEIELDDYVWPDRDNTFRALSYEEGGIVSPNEDLTPEVKLKALKTIELVGLDKTPKNDPAQSDRRWLHRYEAWEIAQRAKQRLKNNNSSEMREQITETATGHAYWSIWMTVFKDDIDMLYRLILSFPGTHRACFDQNNCYLPLLREGGQC